MVDRKSTAIDRRNYLKLVGGTAATVGLAGCTTGPDDEETDAPTDTPADGGDGGDETETPTEEPTDTPEPDFELTVTQGQMDSGLDPQDHAETPTDNIVTQVYEGVLDRDKKGAIIEGLATGYERDGSNIVFTLREGVTFHSGEPMTAADVAYSIQRIFDDEVGFVSPQKGDLGGPTSAEAGDGTVTVGYESLNPIAFQLFATNGEIMQQSWVEANSKDYINQHMNGTGPFKLEEYDPGNRIVFSHNEDYWGATPAVTQLTMDAASEAATRVNKLLEGETDITVNVPPQEIPRVQGSGNASIAPVPSTRIIFLQMRYDLEPFSSVEFRQAMNYAVDLDSIIENVLDGFGAPTGQPTLEQFVGYNPDIEPYPYDPEKAEQLVEASGHAGVEIELQTPVGRYLKDVEVAQAAANQINELQNVTCTLQQRDFGALVQDLLTGSIEDKPPFTLLGWGNGEFDASQTIGPLLSSDGFLTIYKDSEVDQLLGDAATEPDAAAREALLQETNQLLHERAPWVYLHQQFSVYGVSNRVEWEPRSDEDIDPKTASPR